jgi:dihydroxyacetone synthase
MVPGLTSAIADKHGLENGPSTETEHEYSNQIETSNLSKTKALSLKHHLVLRTFRILVADLCQQFNGGHPGCGIHDWM